MYAVEMKGILKQYPSVKAVDGANFILEKGEIHSLLGQNGASTFYASTSHDSHRKYHCWK